MGTPTRFTYGATTVAKGTPLGSYPMRDPFHSSSDQGYGVAEYYNDFFLTYNTTIDWTITGTSSTFLVADGVGGQAVITPGATTTVTTVSATHNSFQLISGQKFWYTTRFQASAVAGTVAFIAGLQKGNAGTNTDGLYFIKPASSTSVNLVSKVNSTSTTLVTGITTAAAATWLDLALHFDGTDLLVFVNGNLVSRVSSPTIGSSGTTLTNALMGPFYQITPTATDTLTVDYVLAAEEVSR
jgi:hypothetical protein